LTIHFEEVLLEKMSIVVIDNEDHGGPSLTRDPLKAWLIALGQTSDPVNWSDRIKFTGVAQASLAL
jgi:hypothetical protein